jgi:hypothetical protein
MLINLVFALDLISAGPIPASASAMQPGAPVAVLEAIVADARRRVAGRGEAAVVGQTRAEWADSALGCPRQGEQVEMRKTSGYMVTVRAGNSLLDYRTDAAGNFRLCVIRLEKPPLSVDPAPVPR